MAEAARPAHMMEPSSTRTGRLVGVMLLATTLVVAPSTALAQPSATPTTDPAATPAEPGPADTAESDPTAVSPVDAEPTDALHEEPTDDLHGDELGDDAVDDETIDDDDAVGDETIDDADGTATDPPPPKTAEPLRPMQTAAWWTMFGAFAVGTTAGVLAGLAERQEDRAVRLSTLFDTSTGAQPRYADRQQEYEGYLRRGQGYARAAIGVGVLAGAATIAAITLFAIDAKRQRTERAHLSVRPGGLEVRF